MSEAPQVSPSRPVATQPSAQPQPAGTQVAPTAASIFDLPNTPDAIVRKMHELVAYSKLIGSICRYYTGAHQARLREFGLGHGPTSVQFEAGLGEASLRQAERVHRAFDYGTFLRLAKQDVSWATFCALATDHVAPLRATLVRLFESGRIGNSELHREAVDIRAAGARSGRRRASR